MQKCFGEVRTNYTLFRPKSAYVNFVLFHIILFSEQHTFLFKNPRQLEHKGHHFRATGEGIKSFYLYR